MSAENPELSEQSATAAQAKEIKWGGVVIPKRPEPDTFLGFDDLRELLTTEERVLLEHDLARIALNRVIAAELARNVVIF